MTEDYLSDKTLVMLVGPTAVGKSTIMHAVVQGDKDFSYARSFTTRPQRTGEITTYRHISAEEAAVLRDDGNAYTYIEHPTTGIVYGTDAMTFVNDFTVLDTLANTVETYRALPFKRTVTLSLTTDPEAWERWLKQRFPDPSLERTERLEEAKRSLTWSLAQSEQHGWLMNLPDRQHQTAETIIRIARGIDAPIPAPPPEAHKMLKTIERLLSYE